MSRDLKIMLFWSLGFPIITTTFIIMIDFVLGHAMGLVTYLPIFLGFTTSGLILVGPLNYFISKSQQK